MSTLIGFVSFLFFFFLFPYFFSLTLPKYTCFNVMRRQLLIAIEGCTDYDLDGAATGFFQTGQRRTVNLRTSTEIVNDQSILAIQLN
jgi:hypothetical protein